MAVHEGDRLEHVAQVFAHFAAVGVEDVPQAQHVAVGRAIEHQRAHGHQGVEPAAGLVDRLAHEIGRVALGEHVSVAVGVSELSEGHRT